MQARSFSLVNSRGLNPRSSPASDPAVFCITFFPGSFLPITLD
jgi:hypothetical protein